MVSTSRKKWNRANAHKLPIRLVPQKPVINHSRVISGWQIWELTLLSEEYNEQFYNTGPLVNIYPSTLLREKHTETKGTIQIQWSLNEWLGILPSYQELRRKRKCARQSTPPSSCFSNSRLISCLYKPAPTKRRRKTTLAIYARFIFIWYDYIVVVPCQKKKLSGWSRHRAWELAIHWVRDIRLLDFQLNFFFYVFFRVYWLR